MSQSVRRFLPVLLGIFACIAAARPAAAQTADGSSLTLPVLMNGVTFSTSADDQPAPPQAPPPQNKHHEGLGIGVKGGLNFAGFDTNGGGFSTKTGYQISLFLGGNRPGVFGVATEITYVKRNAAAAGAQTVSDTSQALEVPLLFRGNFGSHNLSGVAGYVMVGPALDVNLTKFSNIVKSTSSFDLNLVIAGGVEITRFIVEVRYNKGLRAIANTLGASAPVKTHYIGILFGVRFN